MAYLFSDSQYLGKKIHRGVTIKRMGNEEL